MKILRRCVEFFVSFLVIFPLSNANALLVMHEREGPLLVNEFDPVTGALSRQTIIQPGTDRTTYGWTREQRDTLTEITRIVISVVDILAPLKALRGLFSSFSDESGDFDIVTIDTGGGTRALELLPTSPIGPLGDYGAVSFAFEVDPLDFGKAGLVSHVAIGTTGSETIIEPAVSVPESSTLSLLFIGLLPCLVYLRKVSRTRINIYQSLC